MPYVHVYVCVLLHMYNICTYLCEPYMVTTCSICTIIYFKYLHYYNSISCTLLV